MAEWLDAFVDPPDEEVDYWVRANCGCLAPVHVFLFAGSSTWTLADVSVEFVQVPVWAYRMYRSYP